VAVQVRDQAGHAVASSPGFTAQPGPPSSAAVVVRGQRMGEAIARFTGSGLTAADRRLQAALLRAIAGAAGLAGTLDRQEQIRRNLVAAVAHELRTPIVVLQAGHEALLDGATEPTEAELGSLRDEVLRLARMVGDLQDLAAADAAALHLTRQLCDLADSPPPQPAAWPAGSTRRASRSTGSWPRPRSWLIPAGCTR
jgi:signal transduction histidine kinase